MSEPSFYERMGGTKTFHDLVHRFYHEVNTNSVLAPMYPADDLIDEEERLRLFLEQYWGGPTTYSDTRGHPRLRMRHAKFHISKVEHDAWLQCMHKAVIDLDLAEDLKEELWTYFQYAAHSMINQPASN